jgi:hypothetical protein
MRTHKVRPPCPRARHRLSHGRTSKAYRQAPSHSPVTAERLRLGRGSGWRYRPLWLTTPASFRGSGDSRTRGTLLPRVSVFRRGYTRYRPLVRQARPPVGRPRRPCALPCAFMTRCVTRSSWRLPPSPTLGHGRRSSTRGSRGECSTTRQGRAGRVVDCHATVLVPEHRQPREIGDDEEQEVRRAPAGERLPELAARGRRGFQAIRSSAGGFA